MTETSWIWENKEWLFSGLGLAVVSACLVWWNRRGSKHPSLTSDPLSHLMQQMTPAPLPQPHLFWRTLQHVPGLRRLAWRKIYSETRLDQQIRVGVRGDGGGIDLCHNGGDGLAQVWLDIINSTPFPIVIDRITGELTVAGAVIARINAVDRHTVPPRRWAEVYFQFSLSSGELDSIAVQLKHRPDAKAGLRIRVYLETDVRDVSLSRQFESGNCRFSNFKVT